MKIPRHCNVSHSLLKGEHKQLIYAFVRREGAEKFSDKSAYRNQNDNDQIFGKLVGSKIFSTPCM